jgi:predicted transglutaminase-like cysteine proteinase
VPARRRPSELPCRRADSGAATNLTSNPLASLHEIAPKPTRRTMPTPAIQLCQIAKIRINPPGLCQCQSTYQERVLELNRVNRMTRALYLAFAVWIACSLAPESVVAASPIGLPLSSSIAFGQRVAVPIGYYDLCMKQPSVCRPRAGRLAHTQGGAVQATPELIERLHTVTARVNRAIRPIADSATPGLREWRVNTSAGNCKDYALAKRQQLLADGFPSSATLIAIARLPDGEQHAILIVRTDHGDYVLDNLNDAVLPWGRVSYRWEKIQSPYETWTWHAL